MLLKSRIYSKRLFSCEPLAPPLAEDLRRRPHHPAGIAAPEGEPAGIEVFQDLDARVAADARAIAEGAGVEAAVGRLAVRGRLGVNGGIAMKVRSWG